MNYHSHHPFSFVIGQRIPSHLWFPLGELQGPFLEFLVKEPTEGPAIFGGTLDIVVNSVKQGVPPFFLNRWPGHNE